MQTEFYTHSSVYAYFQYFKTFGNRNAQFPKSPVDTVAVGPITVCTSTETEPNCSSNYTLNLNTTVNEEISVRLRCTVNFRGYLVPDVEWRTHKGYEETFEEDEEMTNLADTIIIMNSSITSGLTVVLSSNTNSLSYSCKIYFRSVNNTETMNADNAPNFSYTYIWKMPAVDISSTYSQIGRCCASILTLQWRS